MTRKIVATIKRYRMTRLEFEDSGFRGEPPFDSFFRSRLGFESSDGRCSESESDIEWHSFRKIICTNSSSEDGSVMRRLRQATMHYNRMAITPLIAQRLDGLVNRSHKSDLVALTPPAAAGSVDHFNGFCAGGRWPSNAAEAPPCRRTAIQPRFPGTGPVDGSRFRSR
jgi:hypothetical protein